ASDLPGAQRAAGDRRYFGDDPQHDRGADRGHYAALHSARVDRGTVGHPGSRDHPGGRLRLARGRRDLAQGRTGDHRRNDARAAARSGAQAVRSEGDSLFELPKQLGSDESRLRFDLALKQYEAKATLELPKQLGSDESRLRFVLRSGAQAVRSEGDSRRSRAVSAIRTQPDAANPRSALARASVG